MSRQSGNSVQAQWIAREEHPLRKAFPGFSAVWDWLVRTYHLICELLAYHRVALLATAVGWVTVSLLVSLLAGLIDSGGTFQYRMALLPLVFIAQAGVWSSLGCGAWHYRLPLAALAAAWLLAAHISGVYWCNNLQLYGERVIATLVTTGCALFALSAFAAALFRSITGQELIRPQPASTRLRPGQFDIGTVLWATLLIAAALGLWQTSRPWAEKLFLDFSRLEYGDHRWRAEVTGAAALVAYFAGFRRWPGALAVILGGLAVLAGYDFLLHDAPASAPLLKRLKLGLCLSTAFCLLPALATVGWLRWLGFRLQRPPGSLG